MSDRLVIIGGGQAAFACVAKLRALNDMRPVTILSREASYPYQRPPLSKKYLLGEMSLDRLMFRPVEWYAENAVEVMTGVSAVSVDRMSKTIQLSTGESLSYDKLVFATGSAPRNLPEALTHGLSGIFTIRSFADADRLRPHMQAGKRLLVIGGGYIGLEAASVARHLGLEVAVIEAADRILARVAAPTTAALFRDIHRAHGVELLEGVGLAALTGEAGRVTGAELSDGRHLDVDLVIAGIGAYAEDALARAAGIACGNGITVDAYGGTSDPDVYAMGDCAEQAWKGLHLRIESVQNAVDQGENVALNLTGAREAYRPKPWFWSDQYDVKLQIAGFNPGYDETITRAGTREGASSVWYFAGAELIAVDAINDAKAYVTGKKLLDGGRTTGLRDAIADPATDLKSLI
ncbi:NAD(P)/FAD-dependent oxidoreductase [Rhizobium sp. C1]|uniref:NAD(P)/FAD-dependent oxidoreductase n=1 Tax=Rhizobium sp. C1 TaxID=1349799 RepID=UPI001E649F2C|nr:FAD/NAD(P)-binding oxidoreductase [Rhizobium sp. C1]MCD2177540.1 NAD(P)/FAD-dependent oxidoreductase [Rhizobium sp. C1]